MGILSEYCKFHYTEIFLEVNIIKTHTNTNTGTDYGFNEARKVLSELYSHIQARPHYFPA